MKMIRKTLKINKPKIRDFLGMLVACILLVATFCDQISFWGDMFIALINTVKFKFGMCQELEGFLPRSAKHGMTLSVNSKLKRMKDLGARNTLRHQSI
jgi:hypothetical protein